MMAGRSYQYPWRQVIQLRIISGEFRGRRLSLPLIANTRPTSDKVKEALFNILGSRIVEASFLDLYAGSGSIGIEALSRGAKHVVFVEKNNENVTHLKKNLSLLGCSERAFVFCGAAFDFLEKNKNPFDVIYVDPPYEARDVDRILPTLERYDTLQKTGRVVVEHFHKRILPNTTPTLALLKRYRYGETLLSSYVKT